MSFFLFSRLFVLFVRSLILPSLSFIVTSCSFTITRIRGASSSPMDYWGWPSSTTPPVAPALLSGVEFERLPFIWPIKEVTASVHSAIWLTYLSLASLFALNAAIMALSFVSWFCSSPWYWAYLSSSSCPNCSSLPIAAAPCGCMVWGGVM